ncbi:GumC family protein [Algicella marina]|uniref:Lipopolysaccharide biosynthesis protein n=1 Tax=Algicella marina TaxID=2683284 RepID=A0A6P1STS3_9RHOB|nr:hypothetical protein [Algicella marina]QHQ34084.1 hypothetical protein GO499_02240 [Algicella marina]
MTEQLQIVAEMARMLRRRILLFLVICVIGLSASIYYAVSQNKLYMATASIQIQRPQVSDDLARSTADSSVAERVQQIEQRLMARSNMIEVIEDLGLFADTPDLPVNLQVETLREATQINTVAAPSAGYGPNSTPSALFISVTLDDAQLAADTTNRFVESVLAQNEQKRTELARQTFEFFQEEENRIAEAIVELEREIANFKNKNLDALPEGLSDRRQEIGRLQSTELDIDTRILALEQERDLLKTGQAPVVDNATRSPEYEELRQLEVELAERSRVLAPNHPTILQLQRQIASVETGSTQLRETAIDAQVQMKDRQIASLEKQKEALTKRREELESSVSEMPRVTMELNALDRRLEQLQSQYNVVSVRRVEAETGQRLEETRQSEQFVVLETALVPEVSISASRKKLALMGLAATFVVAFGIVWLLELINPVIRCTSQMQRRLDLSPVVAIPYVPTFWELQRRRIAWTVAIVALIIGAPFAINAIDKNVMPIEEIAAKAGLEGLLKGSSDPVSASTEANG